MVSSAQATSLAFSSTVADLSGSTQENQRKAESVGLEIFSRFHQQIGQQVGGHPSRNLAGSVRPISDSSKAVVDPNDEDVEREEEIDYSLFDPCSISTVATEPSDECKKSGDEAAYMKPKVEVEVTETFPQTADAYPFLSRFILEFHPKRSQWIKISDLKDLEKDIQQFYQQELRLRDSCTTLRLETFKDWELAERTLQKFDGENLKKIMAKLIPILQKIGYLSTPGIEARPFAVLREIAYRPEMVKRVKELNFSSIGLGAIPLSFYPIFFSGVETLSLAGNMILNLPPDIKMSFPRACTQSFFSRYPALRELNLSNCGLSFIQDEIFSVLPHLEKVDLSGNWLSAVPEQFGISDDHRAKEVRIDLSSNTLITRIEEATFKHLAAAKSVRVHLDLRNTFILGNGYSQPPSNVILVLDPLADPGNTEVATYYQQATQRREAGQRRGTFKRGDIPGVLEADEAKTAEEPNLIPQKEPERYVDVPWSFNPDEPLS